MSQTQDEFDSIEKNIRYVCLITAGDYWGTGFFISSNRILTAYHVFSDFPESPLVTVPNQGSPLHSRVLRVDPITDVAMLEVANYSSAGFIPLSRWLRPAAQIVSPVFRERTGADSERFG